MSDAKRTRFLSVLVLAVIFVSGVVVGMAVDRNRGVPETSVASGTMADAGEGDEADGRDRERRERRRPVYEQLGLNESQDADIDSIVRHFRREVEAARKEARQDWDSRWWGMVIETREAIKGVLDPNQAMRYDSLVEATYGPSDRRNGSQPPEDGGN